MHLTVPHALTPSPALRLKKEMLAKIKETKANLLASTKAQLSETTRRTITENEQLVLEVQFQSRETQKMLEKYKELQKKVTSLTQALELSKQAEAELAKRSVS